MMPIRFMVVDDSELVLFLHRKCIEKEIMDTEVNSFSRARKALDYLSVRCDSSGAHALGMPDFILVDIQMPEMNGLEFLNALDALGLEKWPHIRVYVLSSTTHLNDIVQASNHRACHGILSKPLNGRMVRQMVDELIRGQQTDRAIGSQNNE